MNPRGWVWLVVGVLLIVVPLVFQYQPLYLRGTRFPWGAVLVAAGVAFLSWDARRRPPPG